jgi:hypothetical protein
VANSLDNAYRVVEVGSGTTTLSGLTVHGALDIPVLVYGTGHVVTQNVDLDGGACSLTVLAARRTSRTRYPETAAAARVVGGASLPNPAKARPGFGRTCRGE